MAKPVVCHFQRPLCRSWQKNGWNRFKVIIDEFKKDRLRRDPLNNVGAPWKWGIIGEFPESGLVPAVFVYGFMGIDAADDSLVVAPKLPKEMDWAEVSSVIYRQQCYTIRADRNSNGSLSKIKIAAGKFSGNHNITVAGLSPNTEYVLCIDKNRTKIRSDSVGIVRLRGISAENIALEQMPIHL